MKLHKVPFEYRIQEDYLPEIFSDRYYNEYPSEYIKEYCSNPEVSEYEAGLDGTFSAPLDQGKDPEITKFVEDNVLPEIMNNVYGEEKHYDHFYVNCHYDMPGSSLGIHNDYKDFRWLITNQIYFDDSDQGVRLLNRDASANKRLKCRPNLFYSLEATPYSWHDVPDLHSEKRSVLFRVGKRKHKTVANPSKVNNTAYVIINDHHKDSHYAKLGMRMGNLTEAWLVKMGAKNIYHSRWRDNATIKQVLHFASQNHEKVVVLLSGYFPTDLHERNDVCQLYTGSYKLQPNTNVKGYHLITDKNIQNVADAVFCNQNAYPEITEAENVLFDYTTSKQYLNYKSIRLKWLAED